MVVKREEEKRSRITEERRVPYVGIGVGAHVIECHHLEELAGKGKGYFKKGGKERVGGRETYVW